MSIFFRKVIKSRSILLFTLFCFSANVTVSAAMVSTAQSANPKLFSQDDAIKLNIGSTRVELELQLISFGVEPKLVQARLNSMTDIVIATLSTEIDELPAGGDALAIIAFVFLVLLFTDIAGYTDLFPFVKKTSRNQGKVGHGGEVIDRRKDRKRKEPIVIEN